MPYSSDRCYAAHSVSLSAGKPPTTMTPGVCTASGVLSFNSIFRFEIDPKWLRLLISEVAAGISSFIASVYPARVGTAGV